MKGLLIPSFHWIVKKGACMKLFVFAFLILTSLAHADVYEASAEEADKLDVDWTYESIVFEKEYRSTFYVVSKKDAQKEGQNKNRLSCFGKKGQIVGKTILHKYEVNPPGLGERILQTRVISVCKFPELK